MENSEILNLFFTRVIDGLKEDAAQKSQKIPASGMRVEVDNEGGRLYAAHYFKYLITGRGPGKFPPPPAMLAWVEANPDALARAQAVYQSITAEGLAYLIGRKISREGTDIFTGKRQGIDLAGVVKNVLPLAAVALARNEALNVITAIKQANK